MPSIVLTALVVTALAVVGVVANESSHGAVAQGMGLGHHHMFDYAGYHCASHDGAHGAQHVEHMHEAHHYEHGGCPGGQGMHGAHGGPHA